MKAHLVAGSALLAAMASFGVAGPASAAPSAAAGGPRPFSNYEGTWAGYSSGTSTLIDRLEGASDVPLLTCTSQAGAMYQSVQLYANATGSGAGMFINDECADGAPSYSVQTFVATGGNATFQSTGLTVSPGDIVGALVTVSSSGALTVTVKDVNTGNTFEQTGSTTAHQDYTAYTYIQNDLPAEPIPTFDQGGIGPGSGDISWYDVTVNNRPLADAEPTAGNMENPGTGDLLITTSTLRSNGEGFYNNFVAND